MFSSFGRNLPNKYGTKLLDTATRPKLDPLKASFKEVIHEMADAARKSDIS